MAVELPWDTAFLIKGFYRSELLYVSTEAWAVLCWVTDVRLLILANVAEPQSIVFSRFVYKNTNKECMN